MRQLMNRFGKVLVTAVLAAVGLWLAAPCAQAQVKEIKELVIAIGVDADTLNPQEQTTTLIQNMCDLIYDNFFFQDPTGKLHPRLATKYEISPDGLTYTLHLRKGVKFSDGTDFNADAVKLTFDRTMDPKLRVPLRFAIGMVKECVKIDDHTIALKLNYPFAPLAPTLSMTLVSPISPAAIQKYGDEVRQNPVGAGPYCADLGIILEVEAGCVGGEEDGHDTSGLPIEKLYTTPEDMVEVYEALQPIGRFLFAATFGNVHGSYKPGAVKLKPTILRDGQKAVMDKHGAAAEMDLVFHGGSGTSESDLRETLDYGVVKMNIDTDTQYAFTRPIVTHMCQNIEGVLKIDGEVGDKKAYDPRSYLKKGELSLCERMKEACDDLRSTGQSIFGKV